MLIVTKTLAPPPATPVLEVTLQVTEEERILLRKFFGELPPGTFTELAHCSFQKANEFCVRLYDAFLRK